MATMEQEIDELCMLMEDLTEKRQKLELTEKFTQGKINDFMKNRLNLANTWNLSTVLKKMLEIKK